MSDFQLSWRKHGKMTSGIPWAGEKADMFFSVILSDAPLYGGANQSQRWNWLRDKLAGWCLRKAQRCGGFAEADLWIERYKAIRGIK